MKYLSILVAFCVIFLGTVNAQSKVSSSGGKSYTYVMKKIDGTGGEIIDIITINGSSLTSDRFASTGFKSANMVQKSTSGAAKQYEATLKSDSNGSVKYDVAISDNTIDGTAVVTEADGSKTTMAVRGMSTEEWNNLQKVKEEYKQSQQK